MTDRDWDPEGCLWVLAVLCAIWAIVVIVLTILF